MIISSQWKSERCSKKFWQEEWVVFVWSKHVGKRQMFFICFYVSYNKPITTRGVDIRSRKLQVKVVVKENAHACFVALKGAIQSLVAPTLDFRRFLESGLRSLFGEGAWAHFPNSGWLSSLHSPILPSKKAWSNQYNGLLVTCVLMVLCTKPINNFSSSSPDI